MNLLRNYRVSVMDVKADKRPTLDYPKIPDGFEVSDSVKDLVMSSVPDDLDFEAETDKMWQELSEQTPPFWRTSD